MNPLKLLRFTLLARSLKRTRQLDPRIIAEVQQRRLRELLRHAVATSPYYRKKYSGLDLERVSLTDIPPITKPEIMANFDEVVTDRAIKRRDVEDFVDDHANLGKLFLGRYVLSHTSGSQGQPLLIVQDEADAGLLFAMQMTRGNNRGVSWSEAARRLVSPARLAVISLKPGFYPSAIAFEYVPKVVKKYLKVLRLAQTDTDLVERLNAFRPQVLTGYASVLSSLAEEARAGRLRLHPELRQVVSNSEVLSDHARERIESAFGMHVMDNYASGECPFLANGCPVTKGAHVNSDWAILEVVDEDGRPVPDGEPGKKVYVTNLHNRVQPFIRYEINDVLTMGTHPCPCGSTLPHVVNIGGRASDELWIHDEQGYQSVPLLVFKEALLYVRAIREWQVVQVEPTRFILRVEPVPGEHVDTALIKRLLERQLVAYDLEGRMAFEIQVVPRLQASAEKGKFRQSIALIRPPKDEDGATNNVALATAS